MKKIRLEGAALRALRERLGLTERQFAAALDMGPMGARDLADMEAGRMTISGPISIAAQALGDGYRPPHLRATPALAFAA